MSLEIARGLVRALKLNRSPYVLDEHTHMRFQPVHYLHHITDKAAHFLMNHVIAKGDPSQGEKIAVQTYLPSEILTYPLRFIQYETTYALRTREMDLSERGCNGLKCKLVEIGGKLGKAFENVFNGKLVTDHGKDHSRNFDDKLEAILRWTPEVNISWNDCLEAMGFFAYFHDIDQVLKLVWNEEANLKLKPKDGHTSAAAAMVLCLAPELSVEMDISQLKAGELTKLIAVMIMCHDTAKVKDVIYTASKRADVAEFQKKENIDSLITAITKGEIDVTSLSPQQILWWVEFDNYRNIQIANTTQENDQTKIGIYPPFEQEFDERLSTLENDNRPLFRNLIKKKKESLQNARIMLVFVDFLEMSMPFLPSLARKFKVGKSMERPFFQGSAEKNMDAIINLDEKNLDNDVARALFELRYLYKFIEGTQLANSPFIMNILKINVLYGAYALRNFGLRLMNGDMGVVDEIFEVRANDLSTKMDRKGKKYAERTELLGELHLDCANVKRSILAKKENKGSNLPRKYGLDESIEFMLLMSKSIELFKEELGITWEDDLKVLRYIERGETPPFFSTTYDATGKLSDARTLVSH